MSVPSGRWPRLRQPSSETRRACNDNTITIGGNVVAHGASPDWSADGRLAWVRDGAIYIAGRRYRRGYQPAWRSALRVRELLPDFDHRAPTGLVIGGGPGRRLLGFTSLVDNLGPGSSVLVGVRPPNQRRMTGTLVRDRKSGFCLADRWGAAPGRYPGRHPVFVGDCDQFHPEATHVTMGTSPGYTDRYPAFFHGQNIAITGVPAGIYDVTHRVNASMQLRELRYENDAASVRIRLSWIEGVPHVRVLRTCQATATC